jgi:hypothetical protein
MTMSKKNNRLYWLVPPFFVLVSLAIYANTFEAPFYLDDFRNITENISLRSEGLTLTDIAEAIRESPIKTRGISYLSFALNYHFHQYSHSAVLRSRPHPAPARSRQRVPLSRGTGVHRRTSLADPPHPDPGSYVYRAAYDKHGCHVLSPRVSVLYPG